MLRASGPLTQLSCHRRVRAADRGNRSGSAARRAHRVAPGVHALRRTSGRRDRACDASTTRYRCVRGAASSASAVRFLVLLHFGRARMASFGRRTVVPPSLRTRRGARGLHGLRGSERSASTIAITSTATRGRERAVVPTLPRIVHLPRLTSSAGNACPQSWPTAVVAAGDSTSCRSRSRDVCNSTTSAPTAATARTRATVEKPPRRVAVRSLSGTPGSP